MAGIMSIALMWVGLMCIGIVAMPPIMLKVVVN